MIRVSCMTVNNSVKSYQDLSSTEKKKRLEALCQRRKRGGRQYSSSSSEDLSLRSSSKRVLESQKNQNETYQEPKSLKKQKVAYLQLDRQTQKPIFIDLTATSSDCDDDKREIIDLTEISSSSDVDTESDSPALLSPLWMGDDDQDDIARSEPKEPAKKPVSPPANKSTTKKNLPPFPYHLITSREQAQSDSSSTTQKQKKKKPFPYHWFNWKKPESASSTSTQESRKSPPLLVPQKTAPLLVKPHQNAFPQIPILKLQPKAQPTVNNTTGTTSSTSTVSIWPKQNPRWKIVFGVQKRYAETGTMDLQQKWYVLPFIQILDQNCVLCELPVSYALDEELRKNSSFLKDKRLEQMQEKGLEGYLKNHLDVVKNYLKIPARNVGKSEWELPQAQLDRIINGLSDLAKQGYGVIHLPDQQIYEPPRICLAQGGCKTVNTTRPQKNEKPLSSTTSLNSSSAASYQTILRRDDISTLRAAFRHRLKRVKPAEAQAQASFEASRLRQNKNWADENPEIVNQLRLADQLAQHHYEQCLQTFRSEGPSVNYQGETRSQLPQNFRGTLMPYQMYGFLWAVNRLRLGLGAIISDDMGLGKTIQTIALLGKIATRESQKPTLILCPKSVVSYWEEELGKFMGDRKPPVIVYHGANRKQLKIPDNAIIITTYETYQKDSAVLNDAKLKQALSFTKRKFTFDLVCSILSLLQEIKCIDKNGFPLRIPSAEDIDKLDFDIGKNDEEKQQVKEALRKLLNDLRVRGNANPMARIRQWNGLVLDEAHRIKTASSGVSEVTRSLQAAYRVALTGTPIQNSIEDLYSLFNFANPKFFSSAYEIDAKYVQPLQAVLRTLEQQGRKRRRRLPDSWFLRMPCVNSARQAVNELRSLSSLVLLRRSKTDGNILQQIARFKQRDIQQLSKVDTVVDYELTADQKLLVKYIFDSSKAGVVDELNHVFSLFQRKQASTGAKSINTLTKLQQFGQICSHPSLLAPKAISHYLNVLNSAELDNDVQKQQVLRLQDIFKSMQRKDQLRSGKVDACVKLVTKKMKDDPSNRVLIFVWHRALGEILNNEFVKHGHQTHCINGSTTGDRQRIVRWFNGYVDEAEFKKAMGKEANFLWRMIQDRKIIDQNGKLLISHLGEFPKFTWNNPSEIEKIKRFISKSLRPIIILNIKAAGEGINLQAGNIVIDLESWWNPASMDQALCRSYRIGQERTVMHYILNSAKVHLDKLMRKRLDNKRLFQDLVLGADTPADTFFLRMRDMVTAELREEGLKLVEITDEDLQAEEEKKSESAEKQSKESQNQSSSSSTSAEIIVPSSPMQTKTVLLQVQQQTHLVASCSKDTQREFNEPLQFNIAGNDYFENTLLNDEGGGLFANALATDDLFADFFENSGMPDDKFGQFYFN